MHNNGVVMNQVVKHLNNNRLMINNKNKNKRIFLMNLVVLKNNKIYLI